MDPASLNEALNLRYILPEKKCEEQRICRGKAALIAHVNYEELVEECFRYLKNIPEEIDLYINTKTESTKEKIYQCIEKYGMKNCKVVTIGNRGREIRGMLLEEKEVFQKYEYVGFVHDKKTTSTETDPVLGQKFMELIWENTVKSREYIYNCLRLLEENKHLGLLVPPPPYHGIYFNGIGDYWGEKNYEIAKSLAEKLQLNCKMNREVSPLTLGTAFWCRSDALKPLYDYPFREEDFLPEPLPADATLNHAIERIFSFVAQSQGYATGMVMTKEFAEVHIENFQNMAYGLLEEITKNHERVLLNDVQHIPNDMWPLVEKRKKIFVYGAGVNAKKMIQILHRLEISIEGIIVSDSNRTAPSFFGYKVYELSEIELDPESMGIIIAVRDHEEIVRNLNKKGMYAYCLMQKIGSWKK
jgi:rhamnosyltransferase